MSAKARPGRLRGMTVLAVAAGILCAHAALALTGDARPAAPVCGFNSPQETSRWADFHEHARGNQPEPISLAEVPCTSYRPVGRPRAVIVARVSTPGQATPDKASQEVQIETTKRVVEAHGYDVHEIIRVAAKGWDADAAHIRKIDKLAETGKISAVFFLNCDRAFRDTELGLNRIKYWKDHDVRTYWDGREIDLDNPDTAAHATFELGMATNRRGKLRWASNMRNMYAKRDGRWYRKTAPLGYALTPQKTLVKDETKAESIVAVFQAVADNGVHFALVSAPAVALGLTLATLRELIADPTYMGYVRTGKDRKTGAPRFELYVDRDGNAPYAFVSKEVWERAQEPQGVRSWGDKQVQLEPLAQEYGDVFVVHELVKSGRIACKCGKKARWNGTKTVRGKIIPQLVCPSGHTWGPIIAKTLDDVTNPRMVCWECRVSMLRSDFRVVKVAGGYRVNCKRRGCTWRTFTKVHPFVDTPSEAPPGGVRLLDDFLGN